MSTLKELSYRSHYTMHNFNKPKFNKEDVKSVSEFIYHILIIDSDSHKTIPYGLRRRSKMEFNYLEDYSWLGDNLYDTTNNMNRVNRGIKNVSVRNF